MRLKFLFLLCFFSYSGYAVVWIHSPIVKASTSDPYCQSTHTVEIKWSATEVNIDYYQIRRSTDPNWNSYTTISNNINACGYCSNAHYEFVDNGPFIEGTHYYYRIVSVGNRGHVDVHDAGNAMFPIPSCKDWKKQTTDNILIGKTSSDRDAYIWHEESNIMQGVRLNLVPVDKVPIYLQQNNNMINFEINSLSFITYIEVNINNQGWHELYKGNGVTHFLWKNSSAYFNSIGQFNLKVRFTEGNSNVIYHREYDVYVIPASQRLFKDNYCNTLRCWGNNPNGIPVVFSEGFDAYDCTTQEFYYWVAQDIFSCLQANGYNVYLLDNKFGTQDIRNNAAGFDAAVRYVSNINNNQQVIAGGASMGGMIARYAFAKAEQDGIPLPASKFVSIDSPQQGAVVSKKVQDYKKYIFDLYGDDFAVHPINCDAAKELSIYNPFDPNTETSNSIHNLFYNELNSLNGDGYPHLTENIGISFSNNTPNPNRGIWLKVKYQDGPLSGSKTFTLEDDGHGNNELGAGSYLPKHLTRMDPTVIEMIQYWEVNIFLGSLWDFPTVWIDRIADPCYIPYNSALDIVNGQSKFDVTIIPDHTTYHDEVPPEIVEDIVNAIMYGNTKYLQNHMEINSVTYNNYKKIIAGNNVTRKIPMGNYIVQNGANVTFIAGEEVDLEPGFEVKDGATFEVGIQPFNIVHCNLRKNEYKQENIGIEMNKNNLIKDDILLQCTPNPFSDNSSLSLIINEQVLSKIYVIDLLGNVIEQIYNGKLNSGKHYFVLNLKSYPSGMYYCVFETNTGIRKSIKIIKQ